MRPHEPQKIAITGDPYPDVIAGAPLAPAVSYVVKFLAARTWEQI